MYESHFGLTAPPFQLSPDPSFYFDSKGHSNALAYLRFGAYQGEGFIVVTGEIGAGKTTLVRALLSEIDTSKVVAAQVVSTQLEAGDLLKSILTAFGVPCSGLSKAELIASLEAFLTLLATRGQRALLIVDEAQNLNLEAVEEMRMLSNFQFDQHALLQSFLVGQPELRKLLQTKSMEQLRQRVIASCHLGPLDLHETRAYIEHRLRKVGWQQRPAFDESAFERIHASTGGIPRRINVLCNRVLLGAFLADVEMIGADTVQIAADELRSEVGEQASVEGLPHVAPAMATAASSAVTALPSAAELMRLQRTPGMKPQRPLLLVADGPQDYLKIRALSATLEAAGSHSDPVVVTPRSPREARIDDAGFDALAAPPLEVCLNVGDADGAVLMAQVMLRFDAQLADLQPAAVAVIGDSPAMLACALASQQRGLPIVRLDGGRRDGEAATTSSILDRLAAVVFTRSVNLHYALHREGLAADRLQCFGSLYATALRACAPAVGDADGRSPHHGVGTSALDPTRPFGLIGLRGSDGKQLARRIDAFAGEFKRGLPMLWLVDPSTAETVRLAALETRLERQGIAVLPEPAFVEALTLLRGATVVLADPACPLVEQASLVALPVLELAPDGSNAEQVVHAIHDLMAHPPVREAQPVEDRATAALMRWMEASLAGDAPNTRKASGPAGRP